MSTSSNHIVVVGAGQAGGQIVASLRANGFEGAISLVGDEASLPYQRPPLSKAYLSGQLDGPGLHLRPASFYESHRVDTILDDPAVGIDRAQRFLELASGRKLSYDRLAIATGSRAKPWSVPGSAKANLLTLRSVRDADTLRSALSSAQRIAIVGGGFIGLEVAAWAAGMQRAVSVVEAGDRLMARAVAPITSEFFLSHHIRLGVSVHLKATVAGIDVAGESSRLRLGDAGLLDADLILAGIGGLPNDELAKDAGLACSNGVIVDRFARTSDPDIVAAGDCTSQPSGFASGLVRVESVQNAIEQAKTAAASLVGTEKPNDSVPWFWSDQAGAKLQTAGLPGSANSYVLRGSLADRKFTVFHLRSGVVIAADSVNAPADHMAARQLIQARAVPDPAHLADASRPIKALLGP